MSSDKYYSSIIVADSKGNDYEAQRALWKEGKDFQFTAEFCAVLNPDGPSDPNAIGGEGDEEDDGEDDVSEEMMNKIIDTIATSD